MDRFDYFYGAEAEQYSFFRIPKVLFQDEKFIKLSCEAKVLYGIMLDRMGLSRKNGWLDEKKRVYIIFTVEEAMELLGCSKPTAVKVFAELDEKSGIGLIEKIRNGFNCPSRIYVKNFIRFSNMEEEGRKTGEIEKTDDSVLRLKNLTSKQERTSNEVGGGNAEVKKFNLRGKEILLPEVKNFNSNDTDINNTNNTDSNTVSESLSINPIESIETDKLREKIKSNISYECLCRDYDVQLIDELVELVVETLMLKNPTIRISGEYMERQMVQGRLLKLDMYHIRYVMDCLEKNRSRVRNIKSYLLTALYNAPVTINSYYQAKVNADTKIAPQGIP